MARSRGHDWTLDNAEELHRQHSRSFFIPSADRRAELRRDDWVRLVFRVGRPTKDGPSAERMWLTDIRRTKNGRYVGVLTNAPTAIDDLARGDKVVFGPEHVIAVRDPDAIPNTLRAFANRRLVDDDTLVPSYVYHDPSELDRPPQTDGSRSSGWCLMVGDETDAEVDDPANLITPSLGWLAERYPVFGELVRTSPGGRQYGWDEQASAYVELGPFVESDD